jgi:hypothetical protein
MVVYGNNKSSPKGHDSRELEAELSAVHLDMTYAGRDICLMLVRKRLSISELDRSLNYMQQATKRLEKFIGGLKNPR